MTRENKLALVVGFGLILLVGILISDHFSVARNQAAAQLGQVVDPLATSDAADGPADLIAFRPDPRREPRVTPPPAPIIRAADDRGVRPLPDESVVEMPASIEMGRFEPAPARPTVDLDARDAERLPYTIHVVAEGESLSSICGARFGDQTLAAELARYNELSDPDRVRIGHKLRIPSAGDLVRGRPAPAAGAAPPVTPPVAAPQRVAEAKPRTYTVKEGDVLSEIASRLLGSSRQYLAIYEANRDILESPDALQAGMTLKIPRDSS